MKPVSFFGQGLDYILKVKDREKLGIHSKIPELDDLIFGSKICLCNSYFYFCWQERKNCVLAVAVQTEFCSKIFSLC